MKRKFFTTELILVVSASATVFTATSAEAAFSIFKRRASEPECARFLSATAVPPIPHTPQAVLNGEIASAGEIFMRPSEQLSNLQDEAYIFLITAQRQVIITPKYLVDETKLATHKSLLTALTAEFGKNIVNQIVGSGEFVLLNGFVRVLSNGSGNFRGDIEHFRHSETVLAEFGLPIVPLTKRELITERTDLRKRGHTPDRYTYDTFQLELRQQVLGDSEKRAAYDKFIEVHRWLYQFFPQRDAVGAAGDVDVAPLIDFEISNPGVFGDADSQDFFQMLAWTQDDEGAFFAVARTVERVGVQKTIEMLEHHQQIYNTHLVSK